MALRRGGVWGIDGGHPHQSRQAANSLALRTLDGDNLDTLQSELDVLQDEVRRLRMADYKYDSHRLGIENVKSIPDESPAMRLKRLHEMNSKQSKQNPRVSELPKKSANPHGFPSSGRHPRDKARDPSYALNPTTARRPSYAEVLAHSGRREDIKEDLDHYEQDLSEEDFDQPDFDQPDSLSAYVTRTYGVTDYHDLSSDGENSVRCYPPTQTRK